MSDKKPKLARNQVYLEQVPEDTIFSLVGTYSKPFLRLKNGYADMTTGEFIERQDSTENEERCRLLDENQLRWKYRNLEDTPNSLIWLECWKDEIKRKAMQSFNETN